MSNAESEHAEGMELQLTRSARSLQAAITSAFGAVEGAGFRVIRIELERDTNVARSIAGGCA
jgi:hypothetical protein